MREWNRRQPRPADVLDLRVHGQVVHLVRIGDHHLPEIVAKRGPCRGIVHPRFQPAKPHRRAGRRQGHAAGAEQHQLGDPIAAQCRQMAADDAAEGEARERDRLGSGQHRVDPVRKDLREAGGGQGSGGRSEQP